MQYDKHIDEKQPLLNGKDCKRDIQNLHQRPSSRLELAESSCSSILSVLFWSWSYPIMLLAHKQGLTENDLDDVPLVDKASVLMNRLTNYKWLSTKPWQVIMKEFWVEYIFSILILIPSVIACIVQPLLLRLIIITVVKRRQMDADSYTYLFLLFVCLFLRPILERQAIFHSVRIGTRIRNALNMLIYKHVLALKLSSSEHLTVGRILNIFSNDSTKLEDALLYIATLCEGLVESIILFGIICWMIHPLPVLFSFTILLLFILMQLYLIVKFYIHHEKRTQHSDKRIQIFAEFIHGFCSTKMHNWEKSFDDSISQTRNEEMISIRHTSCLRAFNSTQYFSSTPLFALITFGTAWLLGYPLNVVNTFPALLSFGIIRNNFICSMQFASERIGEAMAASQRIYDLIHLLVSGTNQHELVTPTTDHNRKGTILMSNASFSWNHETPCLSFLNLTIENGTFVGILGPVGSGKSSLLAAILGEMELIDGQINTNQSSFAYAAQSPWIFADTIRNNILLNRPFDELQYHKVIYACCLDVDFQLIGLSGDLTIVGDNGVNLSGGQKARISLARALYGEADIYLLDDPFSAVDRIVAKQMYERCIRENGLLKNKTCLLVTHQTNFVSEAKQIVFLCDGRIKEQGSLKDIVLENKYDRKVETSVLSDVLDLNSSTSDTQPIIVKESTMYEGSRWTLWYRWFTAPPLGIFGFTLLILLLLLGEGLFDASNYWLSKWLEQVEGSEKVSSRPGYIYFALLLATIFIDIIRTNFYYAVALNGSNALHNRMKTGLLYTSIQFFENNPAGRILNRVSKDQHVIDEVLPSVLLTGIIVLLIACGSMLNICVLHPSVSICLITIISAVLLIFSSYQRISRNLRGLESVTRSSIYALLPSTMDGVATIRAFKAEEYFIKLMCSRMDLNTSVYFNFQAASQLFALILTYICLASLLITFNLLFHLQRQTEASTAANILTSSIYVIMGFQWALRRLSEGDLYATSAERIYEYSLLPPEEDNGGEKQLIDTSPDWPRHGNVQFNNYSLRHRSNVKYAIRNMNLNVTPNQKLGIIGRTGAGKSSLFKGIFRLINRSNVEGQILIDGVDISCIKLAQLRSKLTIIPQQPILFSGSLRYNLDPCNLYSDEECWKAIEDVQLKSFVMNNPSGLLMPIDEFGKNLSMGQGQLIGISRALLRKSKILLVDEATANVDQETDNLIQKIIREKLHDRTVLTIAHRLETIAKYDRIIVLDCGTIVNNDVPENIFRIYDK